MPTQWKGASPEDQFGKFVKRSGHNQEQKLEELDHNVLDHEGTDVVTLIYDKNNNLIDMNNLTDSKPEEQVYMKRIDNCPKGFIATIPALIQILQDKDSKGVGNYNLGFIASFANDAKVVYIVSINQKIKIDFQPDQLPEFYPEVELNDNDKSLLKSFDMENNTDIGSEILIVLKDNSYFQTEDIINSARKNDLKSKYGEEDIKNYEYMNSKLPINYQFVGNTELYFKETGKENFTGTRKNGDTGEVLKNTKRYDKISMVTGGEDFGNESDYDFKVEVKSAIIPISYHEEYENNGNKDDRSRINFEYPNGSICTLKSKREGIDWATKVFDGYSTNNPWLFTEIITTIKIINQEKKDKIFKWLGFSSQKPKGDPFHNNKNLVTNVRHCVAKDILKKFNDIYSEYNKPNHVVDVNNSVFLRKGKGRNQSDKLIYPLPQAEPPAQVEEPPAQVEEPPAQVEEPPAQVEEPPAQVEEPPAQVEEPPAQVEEPPVQVEEPPAQVEEPPEQVEESPAQIEGLQAHKVGPHWKGVLIEEQYNPVIERMNKKIKETKQMPAEIANSIEKWVLTNL